MSAVPIAAADRPDRYHYEPGGEVCVLTSPLAQGTPDRHAGRFSLMVERTEPTVRYVAVEGPITRTAPRTDELLVDMSRRYLPADKLPAYLDFARTELADEVAIYLKPEHWLSADLGAW